MHNYNMSDGGNTKDDLGEKLLCILSDYVVFKFLAQGYHWNVRGPEFTQFHNFFQEIYEDAESAIDPTAENLRILGYDVPFLLEDFSSLTCIEARPVGYDPIAMSASLYDANGKILNYLMQAFDIANSCNQQGIANFLAERISQHQKLNWQIGTTIGADSTVVSPNLM